jgi:hypothetical protein
MSSIASEEHALSVFRIKVDGIMRFKNIERSNGVGMWVEWRRKGGPGRWKQYVPSKH